jgi:hypothetical protein
LTDHLGRVVDLGADGPNLGRPPNPSNQDRQAARNSDHAPKTLDAQAFLFYARYRQEVQDRRSVRDALAGIVNLTDGSTFLTQLSRVAPCQLGC